jgi:hypothetical protein
LVLARIPRRNPNLEVSAEVIELIAMLLIAVVFAGGAELAT